MKIQAIIPAAGKGERLESERAKPLVLLNGKPIIVHTLEVFEQIDIIDSVILVVDPERLSEFEKIIHQFHLKKVQRIIAGGKTRQESVHNGLHILDQDTEIVLIHDGARPMVRSQLIKDSIMMCEKEKAVITAVPVKPTIKQVDQKTLAVKNTLNRDNLWEVQTPQVFRKEVLWKAHQQQKKRDSTDDAVMVEKLGIKVKVINGDYNNIKITTKEDLMMAEAILKEALV